MQHSVREIGERYEGLSVARKDKKQFVAKDFYHFSKTNSEKYHLEQVGEDLKVSTWYSDALIDDYKNTLKAIAK